MTEKILKLKGVGKHYTVKSKGIFQSKQHLVAVDHLNLEIARGQTLGLVGESGCGKTTLGKMICRLEDPTHGEIYFNNSAIHNLRGENLRQLRHQFQPIFQDPLNSLNPRLNVYRTLEEPLKLNNKPRNKEAVEKLLKIVGLGSEIIYRYAHQLSGGQRQRLGIARALALDPALIVGDEPVSSLDVSIQAQVLNLFLELQTKFNLTMIFISHDLRVVSHLVDTVVVMYVGRIMEIAPTQQLFNKPMHPYTLALLEALPKLSPGRGRKRSLLSGDLPSPINPASGCRFYTRCIHQEDDCLNYENELLDVGIDHKVACLHWKKVAKKTRWDRIA